MTGEAYLVEIDDGGGETLLLERRPGARATSVLTGDGELEFGVFLDDGMSEQTRARTARSLVAAYRRGLEAGQRRGTALAQRQVAGALGLATRDEVAQLREVLTRMSEGGR